ncbi:MAG: 16S rRNA (uracil(1498)-N(3))-methyltransferase [Firmicutes bacterium]|nr:16S rRNA (uracil(1498)-N(3))-methyltransferase [Bacillota bacterium]
MNRFFYRGEQRDDELVRLHGEDAHHLLRVLRVAVGDDVELCEENGLCHLAQITTITKDEVYCVLGEPLPSSETKTTVDLAFGLLKGEKTEFVLQKATELGVATLLPFFSERTVSRPDKKQAKRHQRWQKIVRSAAAQSRRSRIPTVSLPYRWSELMQQFSAYDYIFLFWEAEHQYSLTEFMHADGQAARILLLTGPEGGLSEGEVQGAINAGATVVTLGPRILRAETAAVTAVVITMFQAGEMRR